jgi:transcriptional regulator NrdR family protein
MKTSLNIIKADGTAEEYLHTKVIHTISNALNAVNRPDVSIAESLAEVVTYFLYNKKIGLAVPSNEVLSVIKIALSATGHEDAAAALAEYDYQRRLKRNRTEVLFADLDQAVDSEALVDLHRNGRTTRWDKSEIIDDLIDKHGFDRQSARAVASMVEEKIFSMSMTRVPAGLIRQLVLSDAAAILHAQQQLQPA